ncbi:MarR family winged helix-turn-helix transcriptional regulator [Arachidicoccus sp.]|uniref:MarR family winged helix-turn-helix transcriptional regulator n=1 Tax=Arachidicoccus sp. TaxID=1872624 RepID=UPI003D1B9344
MKFYQDIGFLILGSRLRRMSEYYLSEVNKVYQQQNIAFDASWFPVFYILSKKNAVSLTDIASELMVSHSAISQLVKNLKQKKLIETTASKEDKRHQIVKLSENGRELLKQLKPIWSAISISLDKINVEEEETAHLLPALLSLENYFETQPLSGIILKKIK